MKSKLSKRILCAAITLCMVLALVPAGVSAALTADGTNLKIVYDFVSNYADGVPYTQGENNFFNSSVNEVSTYEKSNGFWKFDTLENNFAVNHMYSAEKPWNNGFRAYFNTNRTWFSMKIRVPFAGDYAVKLGYIAHSSFDSDLGIYMLSGDATKDDIANAIADGTNKLGSVNCTKGSGSTADTAAVGTTTLDAGEYTIVYKANNALNVKITSLELVSGDGSNVCIMAADASADKNNIDADTAGDSAKITVSAEYLSDATKKTSDIDYSDFTFESSDNNVVTVDSNGNVRAGSRIGSADVYVKSGSSVLATVPFTVTSVKYNTNTKVFYDFVSNYADGVPYTQGENNFFNSSVNEVSTYEKSNGFWKFDTMEGYFSVNHMYDEAKPWNNGLRAYFKTNRTWFSMKIYVPTAGNYAVKLGYIAHASFEPDLGIYMLSGDATKDDIANAIANGTDKLGSVDCTKGSGSTADTVTVATLPLDAGEHTIVYKANNVLNIKIANLTLESGDGSATALMGATLSAVSTEIEVGDGTAMSVKGYLSDGTEANLTTEWASSNEAVASVLNGAVKGKKAGSADIIATVSYNGNVVRTLRKTVTVSDAPAPETAKFAASANIAGASVGVLGVDGYTAGNVADADLGTKVTVTAPEVDGYEFKYWKNSAGFVSADASYSFVIGSNISLIAVYAESAPADSVKADVFNYNGSLIESLTANKGDTVGSLNLSTPTLTGYVFLKWSLDDDYVMNKDTQIVAQYEKANVSETVTVNGANYGTFTYDDEVELTADAEKDGKSFSYWTRDGKIVSYDTVYTFYAWNGTADIRAVYGETVSKRPAVVLESDKTDGAYMMEYDVAGYQKVESGIIFGNSSDITVNSCYSKAVSRNGADHGQFTASPNGSEAYARAYVIYKDGASYKVVYSD